MILILSFHTQSDRDKFEYLFSKYKNLCLHKAYAVLHDRMLAEDAVSEAYLRVYKNLSKIDDASSNQAVAFLMAIVRNCSITLLNKQKKEAGEELLEHSASVSGVEEEVMERAGSSEIMCAIDKLDDEYKSVFLLKYAYDMTHKEIGDALGISENNVTVRIHRTKKKLADILREGAAL